jgi:hypothetical protein
MSADSAPVPETSWAVQVEAFALEVADRSLDLRRRADAAGIGDVSELTTLLGALWNVASKLEGRSRMRLGGATDPADAALRAAHAGAPAAGDEAAQGRRLDPEQVAHDMAARGAGRAEIESYLRRHFDGGEARTIARRVLRPGPGPARDA